MSASSRTRRRLIAASISTVVVGGLAVGYSRLGPADETTEVATPEATVKTATVTVGNLELGDRLEGTLEQASSLTVVHRIEGVTATASTAATSSSASSAAPAATQTFAGVCDAAPSDTTPTAAETTTSVVETTTTVAETTSTVAEPTTTVTSTTVTSTTVIPTTVTPTTTVACTTDTTAAAAGGQGAPAGAVAPTGASPAGSSTGVSSAGSASSSTTASTTEMVTSVAAAGSTIAPGDVLYSVEGQPVLAMIGTVPAWRTLSIESDDGIDILQLEYSLAALGYDADGALTIDNTFDSDTRTAVEAWQEGLGLETSGEVVLGRVVYLPATTAVTSVSVQAGDDLTDGDTVLNLAGGEQQVVVSVPAEDRAVVGVGLPVEVGGVTGIVSRLRSAAGSTDVDVQAVISLSSALDAQDGAAVTVGFTVTDAEGVFLVPAEALVSRLDGTYAVRAITTEGSRGEWLTVAPHGVSNGDVAVTGDGIAEGVIVEVPAT